MKGQQNSASTPEEYIAGTGEKRRADIAALHQLIRKHTPELKPLIHLGILAYGPYHYKYPSGREGDWFRLGIANNASYISLYITAVDENGYLAESFKDVLPKANVGKGCVRFKRLSDLDEEVLVKLIKAAAEAAPPGGVIVPE